MRFLNIPSRPPAWPIWACTLGVVLVVTALDIQVARAESALNPTPVSQGQLDRAAFAGQKKATLFLKFLSDMCGLMEEGSIYLTYGGYSWLVSPSTETSTPPKAKG